MSCMRLFYKWFALKFILLISGLYVQRGKIVQSNHHQLQIINLIAHVVRNLWAFHQAWHQEGRWPRDRSCHRDGMFQCWVVTSKEGRVTSNLTSSASGSKFIKLLDGWLVTADRISATWFWSGKMLQETEQWRFWRLLCRTGALWEKSHKVLRCVPHGLYSIFEEFVHQKLKILSHTFHHAMPMRLITPSSTDVKK